MGQKRKFPKAQSQGTYTFAFGDTEVTCSLFSASAENVVPTLHFVHAKCTAKPPTKKEQGEKQSTKEKKTKKLPRAQKEFMCARCAESIPPSELGKIIRTVDGEEFLLNNGDMEKLDFEATPHLDLRIIDADDEIVHGIGFHRRLYAIPLPTSARQYWTLLEAMAQSKLMGFMQIVIKNTAYPAVLRPAFMPYLPLGRTDEISTSPVLVVDCLTGSQSVRPLSLVENYDLEVAGSVTRREIAALGKELELHESDRLTLADCVDPQTQAMLRMLCKVKRRAALQST